MYTRKKNNMFVCMDTFNRNIEISDDLALAQSKLENRETIFSTYQEYLEYIKSIEEFSTVYYNITYLCNLKCPYCYAPRDSRYVSLDVNKIFLEKLKKLKVKNIVLIGGEPMIHPQLPELIEDIAQSGIMDISIITNGTILKTKVLEKITKYKIDVQISVDGHTEETNSVTRGKGSLKKVLKNIEKLKENNVNYSVMQVLTKDTIKNSLDFSNFFSSKEIPHGFFLVKDVPNNERPSLKELHHLYDFLLNKFGDVHAVMECVKSSDQMQFSSTGFPITHCGAGINALSLDPSGNVYPCVKLHNSDYLIANLFTNDSIEKILMNRKNIINTDLVDNISKCEKCPIKYVCGGGCRAEEYYIKKHDIDYSQCELQSSNLNYYMENIYV